MVPFMRGVFNEPDSDEAIDEMTAIGMEASPSLVVVGELEPTGRAGSRARTVSCPVLIIHGDNDAGIPVSDAEAIAAAIPMRASS